MYVWDLPQESEVLSIKEMYRSTPPPQSTISDEGYESNMKKYVLTRPREIRRDFYHRNVYKLFKQTV